MNRNEDRQKPRARHGEREPQSRRVTKTRLRRGEIRRKRPSPPEPAEIIDFLPAVHGDVEDLLCDLSGEGLAGEDPEAPRRPGVSP